MYIDHSVYPDLDSPPDQLDAPGEQADYVRRVCAAWDFGVVPEAETFRLFHGWRAIFDSFPLPHSPAYHVFRVWFGWPPVERAGFIESTAERLDRREGRDDPCTGKL